LVARLAAVVLAVAMVVGALLFRSHMDKSARTLRLTCVEELADACGRLTRAKVTIEPAGTTAERPRSRPARVMGRLRVARPCNVRT